MDALAIDEICEIHQQSWSNNFVERVARFVVGRVALIFMCRINHGPASPDRFLRVAFAAVLPRPSAWRGRRNVAG
jgi:hypothetical protein